jgi:uroporphyrinogen decarboxylase
MNIHKEIMATAQKPHPDDADPGLPLQERWSVAARKRRATYSVTPGAPLLRGEFGFYSIEAWKKQGMPTDANEWGEFGREVFLLEDDGDHKLGGVGWCEAAFEPAFPVQIVEDRGDTEVEQDHAGRHVLYFKGRRSGFMPEYLTHPVKDMQTWIENVKWRLDPSTPARFANLAAGMAKAKDAAAHGEMICQAVIGGYMYLRSLIGPGELLYMFYDQPELIHDCMQTWLDLADAVIAVHQQHVTLDEIFLAEDICYNHGPLIGPDMFKEFLLPYYQQLIANTKRRQLDKLRHLFVQIDTDGDCRPVIPWYMDGIGMDVMSPFEVASGCDVVAIGRQYPNLVMRGGLDKRILAKGRPAIDAMLERILPAMRRRGGYLPMCDHGVPEETPFADYVYFRQRIAQLSGE